MADTPTAENGFEGWVILELMGHRRLAGYLREQEIGGTNFIRIDVPGLDGEPVATQFYSAAAVYCITPTTEDLARRVAATARPAPVTRWELQAAPDVPARASHASGEDDDGDNTHESEQNDDVFVPCDAQHAPPRCADPECWQDDTPAEVSNARLPDCDIPF